MALSQTQQAEFEQLSRPLMQFLSDNLNPHTFIKIDSVQSLIVEGVANFYTEEYIKD